MAKHALLDDPRTLRERIRALRDEAATAGDLTMVSICARALGRNDRRAIRMCLAALLDDEEV